MRYLYGIKLAFYAYCGTDVEDAVAIDNIRWINASSTVTTTTTPQTPTTEGVTEDETTEGATVDEITTESWTVPTEPEITSTPTTERPGETEGDKSSFQMYYFYKP